MNYGQFVTNSSTHYRFMVRLDMNEVTIFFLVRNTMFDSIFQVSKPKEVR